MKVAIVGAGVAGLACAPEFERNGITPDIYEMKDYIGETLELPAILLYMFNIPIKLPLTYLRKNYNMDIKPQYYVKEIVFASSSGDHVIKGSLGYIFRRGSGADTLIEQIYKEIKTPVQFNCNVNINDIRSKYDHIIVATANNLTAQGLGIFRQSFNAFVRIANINGNFKTDRIKIWLNTEFAKHGFGYLVPDNEVHAKLVLVVNDTDYVEFEKYWNNFISRNITGYSITNTVDLRHDIGTLSTLQYSNLYFAGLAGGFVDNVLGFGSIKSIFSGASAAHCIANNIDYNNFMKSYVKDIAAKKELRKAYNSLSNEQIDKFVRFVTKPGIKHVLYKNPLYRVGQTIPLIKVYNKIKNNTHQYRNE